MRSGTTEISDDIRVTTSAGGGFGVEDATGDAVEFDHAEAKTLHAWLTAHLDRPTNEMLAREVMGWTSFGPPGRPESATWVVGGGAPQMLVEKWRPMEDLNQAARALDHATRRVRGTRWSLARGVMYTVYVAPASPSVQTGGGQAHTATTAAEAMCLAALAVARDA